MKAGVLVVDVRTCAICGEDRALGNPLEVEPGNAGSALWVCRNCQHKLTRGLDDEGALGG